MHFEKLLLLLIQLSLLRTSDLQQSCLNMLSDSQVRVMHVYLQNELTSLGIKSIVSLPAKWVELSRDYSKPKS